MTSPEYEIVVTLVQGQARESSRSFGAGTGLSPLSVGTHADWPLSAEGVASIHLWLRFDGQRLYAASATPEAAAYLQGARIGNSWYEVADGSELRLGQARLTVFYRPIRGSSRASPPVPAGLEPRSLTPIERAAAIPLPSFFTDRLRAGRDVPELEREPERPRAREPYVPPRRPVGSGPRLSRQRQARAPWALLLIPAGLLPLLVTFLWLIGVGRHRGEVPEPAPTPSAMISPAASVVIPPAPEPAVELPPEAARERAPLPVDEPLLGSPGSPPRVVVRPSLLASATSAVADGRAPTLLPSAQPPAFPQRIADKPVPRVGAEPWMISEEWLSHHERLLHAPNRARAKVIFLGDSITEGWAVVPAYKEHFSKYSPLNLGIASDVTQNVLWRIEHGELDGTTPAVVVLMIGVNNLAGGFSSRETVAGVRAILAAVQAHLPNTRVLLLGVLPARQLPDDPLRQRIAEANRMLASLPPSAQVSFHDVGSVLLEPDGTITKATLRDFVHPTAEGYVRLSEAVAPLIEALIGTSPSEPAVSESSAQTH